MQSRIAPVLDTHASPDVKNIFHVMQQKMGMVPNIFRTMANSPNVLQTFLAFNKAAENASLSPHLQQQIALTVAQANRCHYCLSAHTLLGKHAGLSEQAIMDARHGHASDAKTAATLQLVQKIVQNRGSVSDSDLAQARSFNISDNELIDIYFVTMLNIFTNYFNNLTRPEIDFPVAPNLP